MRESIENRPRFEYWSTRLSLGLMVVGATMLDFSGRNAYFELSLLSAGAAIAICTASWIQFHSRSDNIPSDSRTRCIRLGIVFTAVIAPYSVSFWLPTVDVSGFNTEEPPKTLAGWEALLTLILFAAAFFPSGLFVGVLALANPCLWMGIWSYWRRRFALAAFWGAIATTLAIAAGIIYRRNIEFGYFCWLGSILGMLLIALIAAFWQMLSESPESESRQAESTLPQC